MANKATESEHLRSERISGTNNGSTLRTRVVKDKTKYTRKLKHESTTHWLKTGEFETGKPAENP